ncbi:MAG: tetratricopeptide repeat protein [Merismopedia sp. SIO2A8]|nr:tetratricopeptide repeat protein [Symploca sp. SIO2B6]NET49168.1 tetratricopeptide repeat protein [Merismopedia sp. SIO2A8]
MRIIATITSLGMGGMIGLVGTVAIASSPEEYRQLGLSYRQQGRYEEAIAALETAVSLEPDHVSGHVILGWTQHLADQDAAAAHTLVHALQLDPFAIPTANALGIVYLVQDQLVAAMMTHLWAAYLNPDNEIAYFNLSLAAQRMGYDAWAIELASRAIALEPYNPHPLIAGAIAHWSKGDQQQAIQLYRQAISLSPHYHTRSLSTYLQAAAFHSEQIGMANQIRQRY